MYEAILSAVADKAGGSSSSAGSDSYGNTHDLATNLGPINIAPVGINLGSILQPINEGNSNTGGYDLSLLSRLGFGAESEYVDTPYYSTGKSNISGTTMLVIGGVILGAVLLMKRG